VRSCNETMNKADEDLLACNQIVCTSLDFKLQLAI